MSKRMSPCDGAGAAAGRPARTALACALLLGLAAAPFALRAATDLSSVPLPNFAVGSSVEIKPYILMVLDDSGSMDRDYLPDWANDAPGNYASLPEYLSRNAQFNGWIMLELRCPLGSMQEHFARSLYQLRARLP